MPPQRSLPIVPLSTIRSAPPVDPGATVPSSATAEPAGLSSSDTSGLADRDRVVAAMEKSGWVQAKAARLLGLTPRQIGYALRKYGIEVKRL